LEGHLFQPFQKITETGLLKAKYLEAFSFRSTIGSLNFVYSTPVGPASLSLNYYENRNKPVSVMFHLGYIIFNKRALE
jgi:NTE family protein